MNVGLRREVDEEGVEEEGDDGVECVRAGDDVDDRKATCRRHPFPKVLGSNLPRDKSEDDKEDEHPQVDVIIIHFDKELLMFFYSQNHEMSVLFILNFAD